MIPMHEGVGAIPTVVLNKLLLPVKISTGFLSFSPAVIVASSFPKMTTSDCHSLIFLYLQHRHVAQLVEHFRKTCIMVVIRTASTQGLQVKLVVGSNPTVPNPIFKNFQKQKRVHRKRGSLSAIVRMGFVYVLWRIARIDSRENGMRRR